MNRVEIAASFAEQTPRPLMQVGRSLRGVQSPKAGGIRDTMNALVFLPAAEADMVDIWGCSADNWGSDQIDPSRYQEAGNALRRSNTWLSLLYCSPRL